MPHAKTPWFRSGARAGDTDAPAPPVAIQAPQPSARARGPALLLGLSAALLGLLPLTIASQHAVAAQLPTIRIDNANPVPKCVTPERLMAFLTQRNPKIDPRFRDIAKWYRHHGQAWRVRWDFAFFQMALETNYLSFRRPDGKSGDVDPRQNNFAGIGATGGGVPGDRFPDVGTGVLAQIQHLVAYSGEVLQRPVAQRTALKQEVIVSASRKLNRPVRFSDLARRWAADPRYARSIAAVADSFYATHCPGREAAGFKRLPVASSARARTASAEPHMQHLLGAADAARARLAAARQVQQAATAAVAPLATPRPARVVARTIWRRGDDTNGPDEVAHAAPKPLPETAAPVSVSEPAPSVMLPGLAALARNVELPIVPPRPQLALRQGH